ncbi:hypothetical protein CKAH01_14605 [Colletotrichum kahawae]|uniref:Uncharacterized protein n=1 Tax=Colletotrichum kahawae TaxID=34407 RepID=A0AAE0D9W3_COLKA|nr:hypothetical protein CKAH01_14605 [Colletotrichum kahawae]
MPDSSISTEDIAIFQEAIALADQTLKLSSSGPLCPVTKGKAKQLRESAHAGLFPASRKNEHYTTEDYRRNVRDHTKDLLEYFVDEAKYHDLIAELCQIFREHYVLKYVNCHVDDLQVAFHKLCGVRSDSHCVDYVRARTNPTWDELLRGMHEETVLISNYESALTEHKRELEREQELEKKRSSTPSSWKSTYVNLNITAAEPWDSLASGISFTELCDSMAAVAWDSSAPRPWDSPEDWEPTVGEQNSMLSSIEASAIDVVPTTGPCGTDEDSESITLEPNPTPSPIAEPNPPPVRPLTPSTDTIKRIAHLFCEDDWVYRSYGHTAEFLQIIKENTPSGRRQRDFNRYTDKLLRGEYDEMAGHLRRDRNRLKTRLHRAEDTSLRTVFSDAINKKEQSLFLVNKWVFNSYDDDPFWRVYPTKKAVEMSVF